MDRSKRQCHYWSNTDCKVDAENQSQQTPLHLAASAGGVEAVGVLLQYGANIDLIDSLGLASLHYAAERKAGDAGTLQLLLDQGAKINRTGVQGRTPLHVTASSGAENQVKALLNRRDIDVQARDHSGQSARELALANRFSHIALLIRANEVARAKEIERALESKTPRKLSSGSRQF